MGYPVQGSMGASVQTAEIDDGAVTLAKTGTNLFTKGADVAAANNLVLGADGDVFHITGATQINLLASTNFRTGSHVRLIFDSTPTIKHGQTTSGANKRINLTGGTDIVAVANESIELVYDGTVWSQVGLGGSTTGSGAVVRATSATLVTPSLGTPSALVLTNATGSPALTAPTFGGTMTLRNVDAAKDGAWKTVVDAAPGVGLLGQAATTAGVNFVGNAASGNSKTDFAQIDAILPPWYRAGATITVRIRAKTTVLSQVSDKVDCSVKLAADGTLGSELVTSGSPSAQMTTSFAAYDFVVSPTSRVAGDCLTIRFSTILNDTGGAHGGVGTISSISLVLGA